MSSAVSLGLTGASYYLPGTAVSLDEWPEMARKGEGLAEALRRNGLRSYHRAVGEKLCDMCIKSVGQTLQATSCDPDSIDLLVYFHTLQTSILAPPTSVVRVISQEFGLHRAVGFSISQQNCVSFLASLRLIRNLMHVRPQIRKAIVFGADITRNERLRNIEEVGIQSDGTYSVLVERDQPRNRLLHMAFRTFGEYYAGIRSDQRLGDELNQMYYLSTYRLIARVIDESGLKRDQIARLLPHNVNLPGWNRLARALKLCKEALFSDNIPIKGHLYGGDGIVNLHDCEQIPLLKPDDPFIIFSMGYGGTFGTALFRH
jgi:3-oxoacyl-[acyl-carrier-protein] synthase-3